jgi:hypothetical protein
MLKRSQHSFAPKLDPPPPLLHDFLRSFNTDDTCPSLGFPFPHNCITAAAFIPHQGESFLPKRGKERALLPLERVRRHPSIACVLHKLRTLAAASQEQEERTYEA